MTLTYQNVTLVSSGSYDAEGGNLKVCFVTLTLPEGTVISEDDQ